MTIAREAVRLRIIMQTLAEVQPHMPLSEAVNVIFETERKTAALELEQSELINKADTWAGGTSPREVADWIDATAHSTASGIVDYLKDGKLIQAIKDCRSLHPGGLGLKEAKDGVEEFRRRHSISTLYS